MLNHAMGSSRLWMASMKTNWSIGLSERVADGRINSEMDTRLPIHVTTARKCSQYVSVMAQVGTVGILYGVGVSEGTAVGGTAVSAGFDVGTLPVGASTVAPAVAGTSVAG